MFGCVLVGFVLLFQVTMLITGCFLRKPRPQINANSSNDPTAGFSSLNQDKIKQLSLQSRQHEKANVRQPPTKKAFISLTEQTTQEPQPMTSSSPKFSQKLKEVEVKSVKKQHLKRLESKPINEKKNHPNIRDQQPLTNGTATESKNPKTPTVREQTTKPTFPKLKSLEENATGASTTRKNDESNETMAFVESLDENAISSVQAPRLGQNRQSGPENSD